MSAIRARFLFVVAGILLVGFAVQGGAFRPTSATAATDPTACINALRADRAEALRISGEQTDNFNATAVGSALDKANTAYANALIEAKTDYFKAYTYAYKGSKTTANTWIKKGNAAVVKANAQVKLYNSAIDKIDATTTGINADQSALSHQMDGTDITCSGF